MKTDRQTHARENPFEKVSRTYEYVHGRVAAAIHQFMQARYYDRCVGKRVLDVGNGGQPPSEVMGERIAATLSNFVGVDSSFAMLQRKRIAFMKVAGDGLHLPFKDDAFDYVIVSGVLHHLGFDSGEPNCRRVEQFISEALRVCSRELIFYEMFTATLLESTERIAARILGHMSTFVLSEKTLDGCLEEMGLVRRETVSKTLSELTSRFYWYNVVMEPTWLRLPAFLSPFHHGFFVIPKSPGHVPSNVEI